MPRSKKSESVKSKETLDRSNAINLKKRMKRISYIERLKNTDTVFKHPISYLGHNFQNFVLFKQYNKGELVVPAKDCLASIIKISPKCIYIFLSRVKGLKIKPSIVFFKVGQKKQTPLSASDLKKVLIHAKEQFPRFTTNIRDIACKWLDTSGG